MSKCRYFIPRTVIIPLRDGYSMKATGVCKMCEYVIHNFDKSKYGTIYNVTQGNKVCFVDGDCERCIDYLDWCKKDMKGELKFDE